MNNTLVNDRSAGSFVLVGSATTRVFAANNVLGGAGTPWTSAIVESLNNHIVAQPAFVDRADYDYTPAAGAPFVDVGVDPGSDSRGQPLRPTQQYVHPMSAAPAPGRWCARHRRARTRRTAHHPRTRCRPASRSSRRPTVPWVRARRTLAISMAASDNVGVASLELSVNGTQLCRLTAAPWSCSWTVPAGRRQTYTLQAIARDAAGLGSAAAVEVSTR